MKKLLFFLIIALQTILLTSCSKKIRIETDSNKENSWKPRGPLFFIAPDGTYKGAIPCKNCPGVEVTLEFNKDNSIVKNMRYIQSSNKNTKEVGSWVVMADNIIHVSYSNKVTQEYYKAQNGGHLIMLNNNKELNINPLQAQFFIFNKQ